MYMQAHIACKLHPVTGCEEHSRRHASHVMERVACHATYHQTDRVESIEDGARSTVIVTRTGDISLEPALAVIVTPSTLQHINNVFLHALDVKVRCVIVYSIVVSILSTHVGTTRFRQAVYAMCVE